VEPRWHFPEGDVRWRVVGVGLDATTTAAAAILPGGLPLLAAYEAYEKLGGAAPDTSAVVAQSALVQTQLAAAIPACSAYGPAFTAATANFTDAQQAYAASPSTATLKGLLQALQGLQSLAAEVSADSACSIKPAIDRWLCPDGTFAPTGSGCATPWQTYALWGGVGVAALVVFAVVVKAVSS
jgi:hypothetical protein